MEIKKLFRVNQEEAHEWLNSQAEIYVHNQNQAYRLIQLIIAAGSLTILLLSNLLPNIQEVFSLDTQTVFLGFLTSDLSTGISDLGIVIGSLLLLLGVLHISDSIKWALKVIQYNKIEPIDAKSGDVTIDVVPDKKEEFDEESNSNNLSRWLANNQEKLSDMNDHLQNGYRRLAYSSLYFLFGISLYIFSDVGNIDSIFFMVVIVGFISFKAIWRYVKGLVVFIRTAYRTSTSYSISIERYHKRLSEKQNMHRNLLLYHIITMILIQVFSILGILGVLAEGILAIFGQ